MKRQDCPTLSRLPARCDQGPVALRFGCGSAALNLCVQSLRRFYYSAPIILTLSLAAATNDLASALQTGLFEEEANHNLEAAAAAYQAVTAQFDKDRKLAATAIFRLGEVYRKQGKTNEAVLQYERIVREFSDQETLATLSRQNLAGLGEKMEALISSLLARAARLKQKELLEQEIKLVEQDLAEIRKQVEVGRATQTELRAKEREVLKLRQQVAALNVDAEGVAADTSTGTPVTDDEEKEIRRIQEILRNHSDSRSVAGRIYVWGQVRNQGAINLVADEKLTVAKAILRAGGFGEFANKKKVKVVRQPSGDSGKIEFEVNMIEVLEQGKLENDIVLQPDDWVIIPSRNINF